ncbi:alcohol dehydrogenase [Xylaria bambusicola]|uniref:alcohol dehydrogenase n=1 Tax=Xylaria bambusicola TaxID=326684 RepID=UPI0020087BE7|nr:alcohol dehydrogenase [Xylaria bambusicola]KAI0517119.1 alcohol dehydrogenase [Xylaria bambusicola]
MAGLPSTMRSLVAPKFCTPSEYEIIDAPLPTIKKPTDVLIRVHVGAIQPGDTQRANGATRILPGKMVFPLKIGIEGSGVVVAVGTGVTKFKPGDEVYAVALQGRPLDLFAENSFLSQYAVTTESCVLPRPAALSHEDAASLPGYTLVAYQCVEAGLRLLRENGVADGLEGKTVFVPGALSGTGSIAIQLLKNHYGVGRVISTVSTEKVLLVEKYLPGLVDQVVDYKTVKCLTDAVPSGSVDFVLNTQWDLIGTFALANPKKGVVVSISSAPHPSLFREMLPTAPFWVFWALAVVQWYYAFKLRGTNIKYTFVSGDYGVQEDLERAGELIATGKVKAVKRVVSLEDIATVREECEKVHKTKGGIGKLVIRIP